MGDILFAVKDGIYIAGAIYFKIGKKLLYKYGASYPQYYEFRGNHFVMWEAIKKYKSEGFDEFDFGRTEVTNKGLRKFKLGWNTNEEYIYVTRYNTDTKEFLPVKSRTEGFYNTIFKKSPIWMLKILGNILYKHIG